MRKSDKIELRERRMRLRMSRVELNAKRLAVAGHQLQIAESRLRMFVQYISEINEDWKDDPELNCHYKRLLLHKTDTETPAECSDDETDSD